MSKKRTFRESIEVVQEDIKEERPDLVKWLGDSFSVFLDPISTEDARFLIARAKEKGFVGLAEYLHGRTLQRPDVMERRRRS